MVRSINTASADWSKADYMQNTIRTRIVFVYSPLSTIPTGSLFHMRGMELITMNEKSALFLQTDITNCDSSPSKK